MQNVSGLTLRDFFNEQIAGPIGVPPLSWGTFDIYTKGSSAAALRPRDLARVGADWFGPDDHDRSPVVVDHPVSRPRRA